MKIVINLHVPICLETFLINKKKKNCNNEITCFTGRLSTIPVKSFNVKNSNQFKTTINNIVYNIMR